MPNLTVKVKQKLYFASYANQIFAYFWGVISLGIFKIFTDDRPVINIAYVVFFSKEFSWTPLYLIRPAGVALSRHVGQKPHLSGKRNWGDSVIHVKGGPPVSPAKAIREKRLLFQAAKSGFLFGSECACR
jgi:hypothetical protein